MDKALPCMRQEYLQNKTGAHKLVADQKALLYLRICTVVRKLGVEFLTTFLMLKREYSQ